MNVTLTHTNIHKLRICLTSVQGGRRCSLRLHCAVPLDQTTLKGRGHWRSQVSQDSHTLSHTAGCTCLMTVPDVNAIC